MGGGGGGGGGGGLSEGEGSASWGVGMEGASSSSLLPPPSSPRVATAVSKIKDGGGLAELSEGGASVGFTPT